MADEKNFFARALDAVIAGRERAAQRYVAQFEREQGRLNRRLTKR